MTNATQAALLFIAENDLEGVRDMDGWETLELTVNSYEISAYLKPLIMELLGH